MVATRAADDLVCVAYVNMVGGQDELVFDGASLIVNEHGQCVARGRQFEEDFVVADLDLEAVFHARLHDPRRRKEKLRAGEAAPRIVRSEEHTSELQSHSDLVCRLLLEKKKST